MPNPKSTNTYQPGLSAELVKKKYAVSKVVKLASNENPLGPSLNAINAARQEILSLNRYPAVSYTHLTLPTTLVV